MITAYSRGHKIYFDGAFWRYIDNGEIEDDSRPCVLCGKMPSVEGYDPCLGYLLGVKSACCGHGIEKPYQIK